MFPLNLLFESLFFLLVFLSALIAFFLYWLWGKRELVDAQLLFDTAFVSLLGALIIGRIFAFFLNPSYFQFNIYKLLFFNVYGGFNYWGAVFGIALASHLYLRKKKERIWKILDLASAPLALFYSLLSLVLYLGGRSQYIYYTVLGAGLKINISLVYFIYFLLLFWVLTRLGKRKRFEGFFAAVFAVFAGVVGMVVNYLVPGDLIWVFSINIFAPLLLSIIGAFFWYVNSKRSIRGDVKSFSAFVLLVIFSLKRVVISVEEAGAVAKLILFSPYFLIRSVWFGFLNVAQEIFNSFFDIIKNVRGRI